MRELPSPLLIVSVIGYIDKQMGRGLYLHQRIVTNSSDEVGWMATVLSKSALVAPILMATANPCSISSQPMPCICKPTTCRDETVQVIKLSRTLCIKRLKKKKEGHQKQASPTFSSFPTQTSFMMHGLFLLVMA